MDRIGNFEAALFPLFRSSVSPLIATASALYRIENFEPDAGCSFALLHAGGKALETAQVCDSRLRLGRQDWDMLFASRLPGVCFTPASTAIRITLTLARPPELCAHYDALAACTECFVHSSWPLSLHIIVRADSVCLTSRRGQGTRQGRWAATPTAPKGLISSIGWCPRHVNTPACILDVWTANTRRHSPRVQCRQGIGVSSSMPHHHDHLATFASLHKRTVLSSLSDPAASGWWVSTSRTELCRMAWQ